MNAPRLTVAICTYNRADLLRQTLEGVRAQTLPAAEYEVLVIDNNSRDHTRAVVEAFRDAQPAPRYLLETAQGLNHARNRAIDEARGAILLFADDDILPVPEWLEQILAPFTSAKAASIGAVGGEVIPVFPDGDPTLVEDWHSPLAFRADAGPLGPRQYPMGANMAFPRSIFQSVGRFRPELDRSGGSLLSGGDGEMLRRIRAAGYEIWFAPKASVQHQMPASRTTLRYALRQAFDSARSRVIERAEAPGATGYFLTRAPANAAKAIAFALLAGLNALVFRGIAAQRALVRSWRACGYLYQIPRSLLGRI